MDGLATAGAAADGGPADTGLAARLADIVAELGADPERRRSMSERARSIVDGLGAVRAANVIDGVSLRPALATDARLLFDWANDPVTRASSFSGRPIKWDEHLAWLDRTLVDPDTLLYVGSNSDGPVGQVRFDVRRETEVSISVAPAARGLLLGRLLLADGLAHLERERGVRDVFALVRRGNEASRRLFEDAGFSLAREDGAAAVYRRVAEAAA